MIDFPDNPTNGDEFTAPGGITWVFQDPLWVLLSSGGGGGSDGFTFVQDTHPDGDRRPARHGSIRRPAFTYVWYEDVDGGQWVQDGPGSGGGQPIAAAQAGVPSARGRPQT